MSDPARHLERLAVRPRPLGSAANDDARRYCADVLRQLGFHCAERPFEFSALPGRVGTPAGGVWLAVIITIASLLAVRGRSGAGAIFEIAGVAVFAIVGRWMIRTMLTLPLMRGRGVNLDARRGPEPPRVWLVAHVDSKSQPVPMLARATGVTVLAACLVAAFALAALRVERAGAWTILVVVTWIAALPVILSLVGDKAAGALDNASGVASVLAAVERIPPDAPVGVLITDAEELGLAGARAWTASVAPGIALNCDGVDDAGRVTVMYSGRRPHAVLTAVGAGAEVAGTRARVMPMIPGVLADNVVFTAANWQSVTLSRGSLRTLRRIHTTSDDLAHLRGTGLAVAGQVLAHAALELCR